MKHGRIMTSPGLRRPFANDLTRLRRPLLVKGEGNTDHSFSFSKEKVGMRLFFLLLVFLCIACTPTEESFTDADQIDPGQALIFPDPAFEQCVRNTVLKPDGPIYASDAVGKTQLYCYQNNIVDISGIEYLVDLDDISLYSNQIVSLEPLRNLKKVRELDLHDNLIVSLEPIAGFTEMKELNIQGNAIEALPDMTAMQKLTDLFLNKNKLKNLQGISAILTLEYITAGYNELNDISAVSAFTSLKTLLLNNNQLKSIEPIKALLSLDTLWVDQNCISDFSPIEYLKANGALTTVTGDTAAEQQNCTAAEAYPVPRNL